LKFDYKPNVIMDRAIVAAEKTIIDFLENLERRRAATRVPDCRMNPVRMAAT
jgi:hypothetical protein